MSESTDGYEFDEFEDNVCLETAKWTNVAGLIELIAGIVITVAGCIHLSKDTGKGIGEIIGGAISVVVGSTLMSSASRLKAIKKTQGSDIPNLLSALDAYKRAFLIQVVVVILSVIAQVVLYFMTKGSAR
jgi:hypothetical protein